MGKKELVILLAVFLVVTLMVSSFFFFGITPSYVAQVISAQGGNINRVDIRSSSTPTVWAGLFGNISYSVTPSSTAPSGGGITGFNIYSQCADSQGGEVYFSTVPDLNFSTLVPADPSDVDAFLGVDPSATASASKIYSLSSQFNIYGSSLVLKCAQTN